jgi:hypothetical protein
MNRCRRAIAVFAVLLAAGAQASEFTIEKREKVDVEYSPHINKSFPQRVLWGDTHLHTTYSPDAGIVGNFNLGPAEAYQAVAAARFSRGVRPLRVPGAHARSPWR